MKHFTLIIAALLFSVSAFAQKMDTDFVQTRVMKVSGKTTTMQGHLTFDGNDKLTMTYSDPEGEYFIIDGIQVKMNMAGKKAVLDSEKVPMVKLQRITLLNCISGNWEDAAKDNNATTTVTEENGMRNVVIQAKGKVPKGGYSEVDLTYRISDGVLQRMMLEDGLGIKNYYELK